MEQLNEKAYSFHYRNLDSTRVYAEKAFQSEKASNAQRAEALNHLAFVSLAKMNYDKALDQLNQVEGITDNQVELLICDVQQMRRCQRQSSNRDFYVFRERAIDRMRRIAEDVSNLSEHQLQRLCYAKSEFGIVSSTYFYYVGLNEQSVQALNDYAAENGDTAQQLNYLYNVGAGGILHQGTADEIAQQEFEHLVRCYATARRTGLIYFEAQALQAMSEHLQKAEMRDQLIADNPMAIRLINDANMADTLLAGNLAQRALDIFLYYGDVYQIAGAYRTLSQCFWRIEDYQSAMICLNNALQRDTSINRAPDLVASIREQLCLVYSAVDDKEHSDENRNLYLDMQEKTRQDRQLEARAAQLDQSAAQLNWMIAGVVVMIVLVVMLFFLFDGMRRHHDQDKVDVEREREEIEERIAQAKLHYDNNLRRNIEQRAKISVVNNIMPFIDRIKHEVDKLLEGKDAPSVRQERYNYIAELTATINQYNDALTDWIQMRQGELSLHIESFPLQPLFDIVAKGRTSFMMKGVALQVEKTDAVIKADKILTLFMINTLADNARKFSGKGGEVMVSAEETADYVEISVQDHGQGMTQEECDNLFSATHLTTTLRPGKGNGVKGFGFGLLNCKGIIDKYRKISQIFNVCQINATSRVGQGSRFSFRLPKGVIKLLLALCLLVPQNLQASLLDKASCFADSVYFSNIRGQYAMALTYADSCRKYLNADFRRQYPHSVDTLRAYSDEGITSELQWYHDSVKTNFTIILDMRNECAVAALALHKWDLYDYNNKVYTQLFRETSADATLAHYCRVMQKSESNKLVAMALLILLLLLLFPAYYVLYYRHRLTYRFNADLDNQLAEDELRRINYETDNLHVSNSVLDNCLSTLKHETMYYPSRISQLIDGTDENLKMMAEVVDYYKDLYTILSAQAMRQIETPLEVTGPLLKYLLLILKRQGGNVTQIAPVEGKDGYAQATVAFRGLNLTTEECHNLFTPLTSNVQFLICRQIVREMGEYTNARGCGIIAQQRTDSGTDIVINLTQKIWKNLM